MERHDDVIAMPSPELQASYASPPNKTADVELNSEPNTAADLSLRRRIGEIRIGLVGVNKLDAHLEPLGLGGLAGIILRATTNSRRACSVRALLALCAAAFVSGLMATVSLTSCWKPRSPPALAGYTTLNEVWRLSLISVALPVARLQWTDKSEGITVFPVLAWSSLQSWKKLSPSSLSL